MPYMLLVTTVELGNPVLIRILVKANNVSYHAIFLLLRGID